MAIAAAAAALSGCGGSDTDGGADTSKPQTIQRTTRVEVVKAASRAGFDPSGIYERDAPGVVTVLSVGLKGVVRGDGAVGSGFVVSDTGEIATNAHVVTSGEGKDIERAQKVYVRFADGNQIRARIVGFDPFADVALLKVDPAGLTLRPLALGTAEDLRVGEPVAAIGSPFGEEQSLSVGIISATDRSIDSLTGFATGGAIQTDAAINSGNSGGPLLNGKGEVLGINSQIRTRAGDGTGVGFAVPVDTVKRSLSQLRRDGRARYAYLGVSTRGVYPQLADHFGLRADHGAWVQTVERGGPGDKAGIRAGDDTKRFQETSWEVGGDVITKVDGKALTQEADLGELLAAYRPGQKVRLEISRGEKRREIEVTLGERPLVVRG